MNTNEAYTFIGCAFVIGALIGSGITWAWATREIMALRSDVSDLLDATFEANQEVERLKARKPLATYNFIVPKD